MQAVRLIYNSRSRRPVPLAEQFVEPHSGFLGRPRQRELERGIERSQVGRARLRSSEKAMRVLASFQRVATETGERGKPSRSQICARARSMSSCSSR